MFFSQQLAAVDILSVLETLPLGIALVSPEGVFLHCNSAFARLADVEKDLVQGLPCRHVLRSRLCVAGCALGCGAFRQKEGTPHSGSISIGHLAEVSALARHGVETDIVTASHKKIFVRLTHIPVHDESGTIIFYLDVLEDLSHIKNLELRLHQENKQKSVVGKSPAMERILAILPGLAATDTPVFLTGETGTGKDLLAETLHAMSARSHEPFVRISVGPMPEQHLLEDLFGSVGQALHGKSGRFQQAGSGTLYISELADIPLAVQQRLIRFLDEGVVTVEGQTTPMRVNARLITGTNKAPESLMAQGTLLPELYYRLNIGHLHLPALHERVEDVAFLLQYFLEKFAARFKKEVQAFFPETKKILAAHNYPGNVREVRNIVEYAVMVCPHHLIGPEYLPAYLLHAVPPVANKAKQTKRGKQA